MSVWHVRDFAPEDLEAAVRLDEVSSTTSEPPVFALADVVAALSERHPAVVAHAEGRLVGSAVSRVEGDRAWVVRLALDPGWRGRGLGSALLKRLCQAGREAGYQALYGYILADNHEMLELAQHLGFTETSRDASEVVVMRRL